MNSLKTVKPTRPTCLQVNLTSPACLSCMSEQFVDFEHFDDAVVNATILRFMIQGRACTTYSALSKEIKPVNAQEIYDYDCEFADELLEEDLEDEDDIEDEEDSIAYSNYYGRMDKANIRYEYNKLIEEERNERLEHDAWEKEYKKETAVTASISS